MDELKEANIIDRISRIMRVEELQSVWAVGGALF
jgi:hypothetical protein